MKVLPDTNTVISAIGWAGPPREILLALRAGQYRLVTSPDLLQEITRVLAYPKLRIIARHPQLPEILAWLHRPEHLVYPAQRLHVITADPADSRILETALAARADVIVSGDHHLLELGRFEDIPVLTARQFVERYL
ncbi:MAG TPA: putative toxin-antitoxin system toxin component, PIN family [Chloroflexota bacterium]|nr:putative toxin-antitoxin system toxin component, PIN family [Chloroflexota bacterium]